MHFKTRSTIITCFVIFLCVFSALQILEIARSIHHANNSEQKEGILSIPKVHANYQYSPTGGSVILGTATTSAASIYFDSWRATKGNDSNTNRAGNYWVVARTTTGLDAQLQFDGVELHGANKLLVTMEDTNVNTASAYIHQICDWISNTGVDNVTDAQCTGGGWRTLRPRKTPYTTNAADTNRVYEIYNGYFSATGTSPGTVFDTPLSNFVESTNNRVLIRASSTVSGTQEIRIDYARVEPAIDSIYEPAAIATTSASSTSSGYMSDLVGGVSTDLTASDGNKLRLNMATTSQPVDMYFSFKNIKTLEGMNTIHVVPEICVSNVALLFNIYVYNFASDDWTRGGATTTGSACTTDVEYGFTFNDTVAPGFVLSDHIENGEVRVRFLTNAPATAYNIQFDRIYMMIGSVNTNTALCEISHGTGTDTNCDRTRSMGEAITGTPTTTTWQATSELEYAADMHPLDNDDDAVDNEQAVSWNLSFPMTLGTNTAITAAHYAVKYRTNTTTITGDVQIAKYGGLSGLGGEGAGDLWYSTPGTDTNASPTYGYFDTWRIAEIEISPDDYVDTKNNLMNLRFRTVTSINLSPVTVAGDVDFAMVSVRWVEKYPPQYIQATLSDNSIGFGALVTNQARYATGDTVGSTIESSAHTLSARTNAASGYVVSINGATLTCGDCGGATISPIGDTATTSLPGTEQFGMRVTLLSGTGTTTTPYDTSLYAFDTSSFPDQVAAGDGDEYQSLYGFYYIGNRTSETEAGAYSTRITYTVTSTF